MGVRLPVWQGRSYDRRHRQGGLGDGRSVHRSREALVLDGRYGQAKPPVRTGQRDPRGALRWSCLAAPSRAAIAGVDGRLAFDPDGGCESGLGKLPSLGAFRIPFPASHGNEISGQGADGRSGRDLFHARGRSSGSMAVPKPRRCHASSEGRFSNRFRAQFVCRMDAWMPIERTAPRRWVETVCPTLVVIL